MISSLIDKQDNFEIVRDNIAQILANEIANQKALAITTGKTNPDEWNFKTYTERGNPWEEFLNINQSATLSDNLPIVNVWFDNYNIDASKSNVVVKQFTDATFNIDCYAFGLSKNNSEGGHFAGDEMSAKEVQRVFRLVRNILMAGEYTYLKMRGIISRRWIQSVTAFQPEQNGNQVQQVQAIRLAFNVQFNEFSPQVEGEGLELVTNEIKRNEDGSIIANADYQYPTI